MISAHPPEVALSQKSLPPLHLGFSLPLPVPELVLVLKLVVLVEVEAVLL